MMTGIKRILFLIFLVLSFSCEDQIMLVDDQLISIKCSDCNLDAPLTTELEIDLDGALTQINVYEGNLGDNILYNSFATTGAKTRVTVRLNKKYTVTATYNIQDKTYIAVDSATPRVLFDKKHCENPCYFVYDKSLDLRLKYTK
jgi:hypothetical protein